MGSCQIYGPFLGPYSSTEPHSKGTQKRSIILTTMNMQEMSTFVLDAVCAPLTGPAVECGLPRSFWAARYRMHIRIFAFFPYVL